MPPKKKIAALVKVQLQAGAATPAPPVGTALGPHGVNIMDFCKAYNAQTEAMRGNVIPVEITIYEDRNAHVLAGAGGQGHGATHHLVSLSGIHPEADHQLDGLVELGRSQALHQVEGFAHTMEVVSIETLGGVLVLLAFRHDGSLVQEAAGRGSPGIGLVIGLVS